MPSGGRTEEARDDAWLASLWAKSGPRKGLLHWTVGILPRLPPAHVVSLFRSCCSWVVVAQGTWVSGLSDIQRWGAAWHGLVSRTGSTTHTSFEK